MYTIHLSQSAVGCLAIFAAYLVALIIFLYVRGNIYKGKALNYIRETNEYALELAETRQANGHDLGVASNALAVKSAMGGLSIMPMARSSCTTLEDAEVPPC